MPRKATFTRDEIIMKALTIVRQNGEQALSARSLAAALHTSSSPIFTLFSGMDEVMKEVRIKAHKMFADYVADVNSYTPAFKEFGLRFVRFAHQERNLFNYLFISQGTRLDVVEPKAMECLRDICSDYGLTPEQGNTLFRNIWTFSCGLAMISNQGNEPLPEEAIGELLSFQFVSSVSFIKSGRPLPIITPHLRSENEKTTLEMDFNK